MKTAIKNAIKQIKEAGFTHIKVELEGKLDRNGVRCTECRGNSRHDCNECHGRGFQVVPEGTEGAEYDDYRNRFFIECEPCMGIGYHECGTCEGRGIVGGISVSEADELMKKSVPADVRRAMTHGHFYNDGSVDSEYTVTYPIDRLEDTEHWIKAFKAVAVRANGKGKIDVRGAGMHISLLTSGSYPCPTSLNREGLMNFNREVTKLLPALFFVASAGHQSRSLRYRMPQISDTDKYSAIYTHRGRCIEYRLFETCYDHPERFYDYIQAIASTLRFYKDPTLRVKSLGKVFGFVDTSSSSVARFYSTPEQLRILNATIKEVKPIDKSFKALKKERKVNHTIASLSQKDKKKMAILRDEYRKYKKQWYRITKGPLTASEQREIDWLIAERGMGYDEARRHVRGRPATLITWDRFLSQHQDIDTGITVTV